MVDIILGIVLVLILGCAIGYIVRAKKSGQTCIGCPSAKQCAQHRCSGGCGCGGGCNSDNCHTEIKSKTK